MKRNNVGVTVHLGNEAGFKMLLNSLRSLSKSKTW